MVMVALHEFIELLDGNCTKPALTPELCAFQLSTILSNVGIVNPWGSLGWGEFGSEYGGEPKEMATPTKVSTSSTSPHSSFFLKTLELCSCQVS